MITAIREVRKAKGLTLQEVADRCDPPTTAQTIGRLETGTRTVSVDWLNRIADALGVEASELVELPEQSTVPVAATLGADGAYALRQPASLTPPHPAPGMVGMTVTAGIGEYRSGDEIWLRRVEAGEYAGALNRDVLIPRPAGRFVFGRLIGREGDQIQILPLGPGARQQIFKDPEWMGVAETMVRRV